MTLNVFARSLRCVTHRPPVLRDISERGRDLESILAQYITFVKPAFEEFCLPVSVSRSSSFPHVTAADAQAVYDALNSSSTPFPLSCLD